VGGRISRPTLLENQQRNNMVAPKEASSFLELKRKSRQVYVKQKNDFILPLSWDDQDLAASSKG